MIDDIITVKNDFPCITKIFFEELNRFLVVYDPLNRDSGHNLFNYCDKSKDSEVCKTSILVNIVLNLDLQLFVTY